jgi:hypothetical protein
VFDTTEDKAFFTEANLTQYDALAFILNTGESTSIKAARTASADHPDNRAVKKQLSRRTGKLHSSRISTRAGTSLEVSRSCSFQYSNHFTDNRAGPSPQRLCLLIHHPILPADTGSPLRLPPGSAARRTFGVNADSAWPYLALTWPPTDLHRRRWHPPLDEYVTTAVDSHGRGVQFPDRSKGRRCEALALG